MRACAVVLATQCWGPVVLGLQPFMGLLGNMFPRAQFVITGVLGPGSNAHGPNEFLHIPTGERVTATVALLLNLAANHL